VPDRGGNMSKKWYNLFVSTDSSGAIPKDPSGPPVSAAQTVADIAAGLGDPPTFAGPVADPTSFEQVYAAAKIEPPAHGFTILKIAEMLQSEHIKNLPAGVRKSSILVALEASLVNLRDVIEDAVRRDRALDAYEQVQQQALDDLEKRKTEESRGIQQEMDRIVAEHRARIQANSGEIENAKEKLRDWRLRKQQEEQRIFEAVSYFVTENPITLSSPPAPQPQKPKEAS
jgi:hypothetical protein